MFQRIGLRASTSPPRIIFSMPMRVFTTEQYCARLFTTISSRPSMYSLDVGSHWSGIVAKVSNL